MNWLDIFIGFALGCVAAPLAYMLYNALKPKPPTGIDTHTPPPGGK